MRVFSIVGYLCAAVPTPSLAASIYTEVSSGGVEHAQASKFSLTPDDYVSSASLRSVAPGSEWSAWSYGDGMSGETSLAIMRGANDAPGRFIGASIYFDEYFSVSGSGLVQYAFDYSVSWALASISDYQEFSFASAVFEIGSIAYYEQAAFGSHFWSDFDNGDRSEQSFSATILYEQDVTDGEQMYFSAVAHLWLPPEVIGSIEFNGVVSLASSKGTDHQFDDPNFLSKSPTPIPLPGGASLVIAAMAAMTLVRLRGRTEPNPDHISA